MNAPGQDFSVKLSAWDPPAHLLQPKVNWTVQQLFDLSGSDRLAQSE
jgi:hypothetical protein